jgi:hypothetical protein
MRPQRRDSIDRARIHAPQIIEAPLAAAHGRVSGRPGAGARLSVPVSTLESNITRSNIDKLHDRHPPFPRFALSRGVVMRHDRACRLTRVDELRQEARRAFL